jgi:hypothetical protein
VLVRRQHFFAIRRYLTDPALCGDDAVDNGCDNDVANDDPDYYPDYAPPPTLVAQEGLKRPLTRSVLVRISLFNGRITTQRIQYSGNLYPPDSRTAVGQLR